MLRFQFIALTTILVLGLYSSEARAIPIPKEKAQLPAGEIRQIVWAGFHIYASAFSHNNQFYALGGDSNAVRVWETISGKQVAELKGHGGWIQDLEFSADNKFLLSASMDGTVKVWDVEKWKEQNTFNISKAGLLSVALSPDNKNMVTAGIDSIVRVWDVKTGKNLLTFQGPTVSCYAKYTPDGKGIVVADAQGNLYLLDAATGKPLWKSKVTAGVIWGIHFNGDGKQIVVYGSDFMARSIQMEDGKEKRKLDLGNDLADIHGVVVSVDGKYIITGHSNDLVIRIREIESGKEIAKYPLKNVPRGLALSSDGQYLTSGSYRGIVYLWKLPNLDGK